MAAAAALLLACSVSFAAYSLALGTVDANRWKKAEEAQANHLSNASRIRNEAEQAVGDLKTTDQIGQHLVGNVEGGSAGWSCSRRSTSACRPTRPRSRPRFASGRSDREDPATQRPHITNLECVQVEDVARYAAVKSIEGEMGAAAPAGAATSRPAGRPAGPTGPGWIVQLTGHHYHNADRTNQVPSTSATR